MSYRNKQSIASGTSTTMMDQNSLNMLLKQQNQLLQKQQQNFRTHQSRFLETQPTRKPSEDDLFEMASMLADSPPVSKTMKNSSFISNTNMGNAGMNTNVGMNMNLNMHSGIMKMDMNMLQMNSKAQQSTINFVTPSNSIRGGNNSLGEAAFRKNQHQLGITLQEVSNLVGKDNNNNNNNCERGGGDDDNDNLFDDDELDMVLGDEGEDVDKRRNPKESIAKNNWAMQNARIPVQSSISHNHPIRKPMSMRTIPRPPSLTQLTRNYPSAKPKSKSNSNVSKTIVIDDNDNFLQETSLDQLRNFDNKSAEENQDEWCLIDFGDDDNLLNEGGLSRQRSFGATTVEDQSSPSSKRQKR